MGNNTQITGKEELTATVELAALPKGADGRVVSVHGDGAVARRLMEMGVVPGATVRMVKSAPFGDPLEIRVRGYSLALRKNEASSVEVCI
jgi:Fe2+ transport system protein FeoA